MSLDMPLEKPQKEVMPDLPTVRASRSAPPPGWALLQRQLMHTMEEAALIFAAKYTSPGGIPYYADDVDDLFEVFGNWNQFYALGADRRLLDHQLHAWNGTVRAFSAEHPFFAWVVAQMHNEYYAFKPRPGDSVCWQGGTRWVAEWHHQSEGNTAFYGFGVADPAHSEHVRRACRFAAMFIGEDPQAPNYDAQHKILRSPFTYGDGPVHHANLNHVQTWLHGGQPQNENWTPKPMGVRTTLYPVIKNLEDHWWKDPQRSAEIVALCEKMMLDGDSANNLAATALVTNAFLYTGEEKYRQWVLEYVDVWMERIQRNKGILPDNVGPTGQIGEHRQGQWWGGLYGWNHYQGYNVMFHGLVIAAECAHLLSGEARYLEILRCQVRMLLSNARTAADGQLEIPARYGPDGWEEYRPLRLLELGHLYHASMAPEDRELLLQVRAGDKRRDWNMVEVAHEKNVQFDDGHQNMARFQYYEGENPGWPEAVLQADYELALQALQAIRSDVRDPAQIIAENRLPANPVLVKALTQTALGAPQTVYNGGLLRATVRYFDRDTQRPGLPPDVSALVYKLEDQCTGLELVNLSPTQERRLIVQSGAFGEHAFSRVGFHQERRVSYKEVEVTALSLAVEGKYLGVDLPPATSIRLELGMRRFVNQPSYAFPWHRDGVPVG
jgi:hypothetical protein